MVIVCPNSAVSNAPPFRATHKAMGDHAEQHRRGDYIIIGKYAAGQDGQNHGCYSPATHRWDKRHEHYTFSTQAKLHSIRIPPAVTNSGDCSSAFLSGLAASGCGQCPLQHYSSLELCQLNRCCGRRLALQLFSRAFSIAEPCVYNSIASLSSFATCKQCSLLRTVSVVVPLPCSRIRDLPFAGRARCCGQCPL